MSDWLSCYSKLNRPESALPVTAKSRSLFIELGLGPVNYGKADGSSPQERYKAVKDLLSMPLSESPAVLSKYEVIADNAQERARNTEVLSDWAAQTEATGR